MFIKNGDAQPILSYVDDKGNPVEYDENGNPVVKEAEKTEENKPTEETKNESNK